MIVIHFPTIMDGSVVRWYRTIDDAKQGLAVTSASRNSVFGFGELTPEIFNAAWEIHERLKGDPGASVADITTHRKSFGGGIITPVVRDEVTK